MPIEFRCVCCRRLVRRNPRCKDQEYCGTKFCQQARKNKWQREKLKTDKDYQDDKRRSQRAWQLNNPDYWKQYRRSHPDYCERNRQLQSVRDQTKDSHTQDNVSAGKHLAKKDGLTDLFNDTTVRYFICPADKALAKKDRLTVIIVPISR